jgi:uncharacterized membrane protein YbaN (DUF454 family)
VIRKPILIVVGTLSLVTGIIGIFVPILPTTPFLLLASACYVRSSERMHRWLLNHGKLGAYIRAFEEGRGIPARAKAIALITMWPGICYGAWIAPHPALSVFLILTAVTVSIYLLRLPTAPRIK